MTISVPFCEQEVNKQLIFLSALIRPSTEEEDGGLLSNFFFLFFFRNAELSPPARLQQAEYVLLLISSLKISHNA